MNDKLTKAKIIAAVGIGLASGLYSAFRKRDKPRHKLTNTFFSHATGWCSMLSVLTILEIVDNKHKASLEDIGTACFGAYSAILFDVVE